VQPPGRDLQGAGPLRQEREAARFGDDDVSPLTDAVLWVATTAGAVWVGRQNRGRSSTPRALTPSDGLIFLPSPRERAT
jgi:hypothetical protein